MDRSPTRPLLAVLVLLPAVASTATLSGQIQLSTAKTAAANATVHVKCNGATHDADANPAGLYRLDNLPMRKWCHISVSHGGRQSTAVRVFLANHHNSANLELRPWLKQWLLRKQ